MIKNPKIYNLSREILSELSRLIGSNVTGYSVRNADRGRKVEDFISQKMREKNINGFKINNGKGKDCSYFEIKSIQMTSNGLRPSNDLTISGTTCDRGKKYANSNFKEKASLILFICLNTSGRITDIKLSNYTQVELALGYYRNNDMVCGLNGAKFTLNKKYFLTHTLSVKDIDLKDIKTTKPIKNFFYWMKEIKKLSEPKSFGDWLKMI